MIVSSRLKTKCDHCDKPLTPDKWEQSDWLVYCTQECQQAADKELYEYFQSKLNRGMQ